MLLILSQDLSNKYDVSFVTYVEINEVFFFNQFCSLDDILMSKLRNV